MPRREKLVAGVAAVLVIFTGWGLSGIFDWAKITLFVLGCSCFVLAIIPMPAAWDTSRRANEAPWKRLLKFPIFWLGGLYVIYTMIQALNPMYVRIQEGSKHWLQPVNYIEWLPHGIAVPWEKVNMWQAIIFQSGAWLFVCALWIAIQHRRSVLFLVWTSVLSCALMVALAILVHFSGSDRLLWSFPHQGSIGFFGSFYYPNHAGAFLVLNLGLCLGLALFYFHQASNRGAKSSPFLFLISIALLHYAGLWVSDSRGGVLFGTAVIAIFFMVWIASVMASRTLEINRGSLAGGVFLSVLILCVGLLFGAKLDIVQLNKEVQQVVQDAFGLAHTGESDRFMEKGSRARFLFMKATVDMWKEEPFTGFGLGSYRFYIGVHQRNYPEIYISQFHTKRQWREQRGFDEDAVLTVRLKFAHSDWLQSLAEVGVIGTSILMGILGYWVIVMVKRIFFPPSHKLETGRAGQMVWGATFGVLFFYAAVEFVFWSPSVYYAFVLIPVVTLKSLR